MENERFKFLKDGDIVYYLDELKLPKSVSLQKSLPRSRWKLSTDMRNSIVICKVKIVSGSVHIVFPDGNVLPIDHYTSHIYLTKEELIEEVNTELALYEGKINERLSDLKHYINLCREEICSVVK